MECFCFRKSRMERLQARVALLVFCVQVLPHWANLLCRLHFVFHARLLSHNAAIAVVSGNNIWSSNRDGILFQKRVLAPPPPPASLAADLCLYHSGGTHSLAADFVISLISSLLCMAYLSREKPPPVEEGKPKRPPPVKGTRSPVPCYFRWLQHISWVLTCISSMVVLSVFWMTIVSFRVNEKKIQLVSADGAVRQQATAQPMHFRQDRNVSHRAILILK